MHHHFNHICKVSFLQFATNNKYALNYSNAIISRPEVIHLIIMLSKTLTRFWFLLSSLEQKNAKTRRRRSASQNFALSYEQQFSTRL
mmetsp:Transcript_28306/g.45535  ORF Transcript_28306/g.45535 Transcript_28306/m.45535 type:complete len:87 (-) Transcript_28306:552-812(-)